MSGKGAKGLSGKGAKGTMGDKKGDKKKPTSRSARAGLQFPVGRIHRLLKVKFAPVTTILCAQPSSKATRICWLPP
jgi:histone H2A